MDVKNVILTGDLGNELVVTGGKVKVASTTYVLTSNANLTNQQTPIMVTYGRLAFIKLDFTRTITPHEEVLFTLPLAAPTFIRVAETQLYDGNTIRIDPGTRELRGNSTLWNRRYVCSIIGLLSGI